MVLLAQFVAAERKKGVVYPPKSDVFAAFEVPFEDVKVVIVGQDPYHGEGQAHGLSFSVPMGVKQPPSLQNIFKELQDDLGISPPSHGNLHSWAKQGVLMLNAVLTVRARTPQSHAHQGWETFTDAVIEKLAERDDPVVFVLWGKFAQEKCRNALAKTTKAHCVLTAAHPSPFAARNGFFGCRHFSKINDYLKRQGKQPIDWKIDG